MNDGSQTRRMAAKLLLPAMLLLAGGSAAAEMRPGLGLEGTVSLVDDAHGGFLARAVLVVSELKEADVAAELGAGLQRDSQFNRLRAQAGARVSGITVAAPSLAMHAGIVETRDGTLGVLGTQLALLLGGRHVRIGPAITWNVVFVGVEAPSRPPPAGVRLLTPGPPRIDGPGDSWAELALTASLRW